MSGKIFLIGVMAIFMVIMAMMFVSYTEVRSVKNDMVVRDMVENFRQYQSNHQMLPETLDNLVKVKRYDRSVERSPVVKKAFGLVKTYEITHRELPADDAIKEIIQAMQ